MVLSNIKPRNSERGFTIVELLIVIVVIAILATITIVAYSGITSRANNTKAQANAASVQKVAEAFNADNGRYPATVAEFTTNPATTPSTKLPSGVTVISGLAGTSGTVFTGTDPLIAITAANKASTITYACFVSCTSSTGGRITYWDFTTGAQAATTIFVGSGAATGGAFLVLP
jgi:prepilin-type N-terminal cleavage/methylation domain-containing protein